MNKFFIFLRILLSALFSLGLIISNANAASLNELAQNERVQINAWLDKTTSISEGEELTLSIEILTDTWFSNYAKINRFDIDGAVVIPQANLPASTSVKVIDGKNYTTELWQLKLYPLASTQYVIAPISVEVTVFNQGQDISGTLLTKPIKFTASKPSAYFSQDNHHIVANEVNLAQNWRFIQPKLSTENNEESDAVFHIGDAIERTITLTGYDTAAMLLPTFLTSKDYDFPSGRSYIGQSERKDTIKQQRTFASHSEKVTIMIEQAGQIVVPDITLYWWNLAEEKLEVLVLKGQVITAEHTLLSYLQTHIYRLIVMAILVVLSVFSLYKLYQKAKRHKDNRMLLSLTFYHSLLKKNWSMAETTLYQKLLKSNDAISIEESPLSKDEPQTYKAFHQGYQLNKYGKKKTS